ncbi:MAG: glycerate 2-kinase [Abditibacteriota bacterium]|nr:glycerate 2-kinase [Abditibacteriota bacterium]
MGFLLLSILCAPDSLKGSLSAVEACAALEAGVRRALQGTAGEPGVQSASLLVPLADGGEGLLEAVLTATGGTRKAETVRGPLGKEVRAMWAKLPDGCALIEMAQASGLTLVAPAQRDALRASTYGTGELVHAALDDGCREIVIGIGGSATTDGGAGMLHALGARLLDKHNAEIMPGGIGLSQLASIDLSGLDARLAHASIEVLCDVSNPLCGERGAALIYGPQKGASSEQVKALDAALSNFANITAQTTNRDFQNHHGAGAAGGLGFGLMSFCGAKLVSGIDKVLSLADFDAKLESADLVLTAEGCIDAQTLSGKALFGIARRARDAKKGAGVPVIAFAGAVKLSGVELAEMGIIAALPIADAPMSLEESIERAEELLCNATERVLRLWLGRKE